jgi:hypothetical protein
LLNSIGSSLAEQKEISDFLISNSASEKLELEIKRLIEKNEFLNGVEKLKK